MRLNGVKRLDQDGSEAEYRKDIRPYMQPGRNRFEITFFPCVEEESLLLEEDMDDLSFTGHVAKSGFSIGIWQAPYLQLVRVTSSLSKSSPSKSGIMVVLFKVDVIYQTLLVNIGINQV